MGVFSDLRATAKTIDFSTNRVGIERADVHQLDAQEARLGDVGYPTGYDAVNEEQTIPDVTADDGTYTLTFTMWDGSTFTTGALNHDDDAETIQTAVDTAADGVVAGYTAGDIDISGGPIDDADIEVVFDGDSVAGQNHGVIVVNSSLEASMNPVAAPTVTVDQEGQENRPAWAILKLLGVIDGTPPVQGEVNDSDYTADTNPNVNPYYPSQGLIRALAYEASVQDKNAAVEADILSVVGL